MITDITAWMDEMAEPNTVWYVKRLSGNDTLANGTHQAGPYIPKDFLFSVFPSLNRPKDLNPEVRFDLFIDSHPDHRRVRAIWYNNKLFGKTRNETRLTNFGGQSSALLDPESTRALVIFAFQLNRNHEAEACHAWVCRHETEEDLAEATIGPIEPGEWKIWTPEQDASTLFARKARQKSSCILKPGEFPEEWLLHFPSGADIVRKTIELRPAHGLDPDLRLIKRRDCEYDIFRSMEEAIELPVIKKGFGTIDDFLARAQTILQRRKSRSGRSLELHTREVFIEEGLTEGEDFSHQPVSDPGQKPDFLFPSEQAYKDMSFPEDKLRMLAVKTTCKDRWRQILVEAKRVKHKHLLTLQEGISENQFLEVRLGGVQLVVPGPLISHYPHSVQPHLQTVESFIADFVYSECNGINELQKL